jgi:hypothetical protein
MSRRASLQDRLESLYHRGFDLSTPEGRDEYGRFSAAIVVRCSQCAALVICGVPTHEHGCPNGRCYDCRECGQRYYRDAEAAAQCCAPVEENEPRYACTECGEEYDSEGEAEDCCTQYDPRGPIVVAVDLED